MSDSSEGIDDQQPASKGDAPIQTDLYCLECGYNLRGLSGDPVRCPECGNFNPVALIVVPADEIRRQLKRMESAPTCSVIGMLLTSLSAIPVALILSEGGRLEGIACPLVALLSGLLLWIGGVARFWGSCLGKTGWLAALLRFQAVAFFLIALIGMAFWGGYQLSLIIDGPDYDPSELSVVMMGIAGVVLVAMALWSRPLHRWLKAPMERLQRQVAVEIARKRLRKKMHREKRWMKSR